MNRTLYRNQSESLLLCFREQKNKDIFLPLSCILSFFLNTSIKNFVNIPYLDYILLALLGIYCLANVNALTNKRVITLNVFVILFSLWTITTSYINKDLTSRNAFLASVVYCGQLIELIAVCEIAYVKNNLFSFIKIYLLLYSVFTIVLFFQAIYFNLILGLSSFDSYLIGGNFAVCYFVYRWAALFFFYLKLKRIKTNLLTKLIVIFICLFISFVTKASTSIIAGFFFAFIVFFESKTKKVVVTRLYFVIVFSICLLFIFVYQHLLNIPFVNSLFVALGEDSTMTGRTTIYELLPQILGSKLFTGYGYGNNNEIIYQYTGCYDAQNGFWNIAFSSGLVGGCLYACIFAFPFFQKQTKHYSFYFYAYFTYIMIASLVEISYTLNLLLFSTLAFLINKTIDRRTFSNYERSLF